MGKLTIPQGKYNYTQQKFPPIGIPDYIQVINTGTGLDGIYRKIIGSILIPPFANYNKGFYYVKEDYYYIGPVNIFDDGEVRWASTSLSEENLHLGVGGSANINTLPYNGSSWSSFPMINSTILAMQDGNINTERYIIKELKSSEGYSSLNEYLYKDFPLEESTLINMFDPTAENNSAFSFYDGSIEEGISSNYIDVYSDGENWRDQTTDEIINEIIIPKGKTFIFYMLDSTSATFPAVYLGIGLIIHKLNSGKMQTNVPISTPYPPLLIVNGLSPVGNNFQVLINTDQDFATYLSQVGYEINNYKQFIFNTYGININFNQHFIILEAKTTSSLGEPPYEAFVIKISSNEKYLNITYQFGFTLPIESNYFRIGIFNKNLNLFNTVNYYATTFQQITL